MDTTTVLVVRRKLLGIKQQDLADVLGISRQHYASIEHGEVSPSVGTAFRLSARLGGSVYEYFNDQGFARGWSDAPTKYDYVRSLPDLGSFTGD